MNGTCGGWTGQKSGVRGEFDGLFAISAANRHINFENAIWLFCASGFIMHVPFKRYHSMPFKHISYGCFRSLGGSTRCSKSLDHFRALRILRAPWVFSVECWRDGNVTVDSWAFGGFLNRHRKMTGFYNRFTESGANELGTPIFRAGFNTPEIVSDWDGGTNDAEDFLTPAVNELSNTTSLSFQLMLQMILSPYLVLIQLRSLKWITTIVTS